MGSLKEGEESRCRIAAVFRDLGTVLEASESGRRGRYQLAGLNSGSEPSVISSVGNAFRAGALDHPPLLN